MPHLVTIPLSENGVISVDEQIDSIIATSTSQLFGTTDIFLFSHGWWTTAVDALRQYNIATTDMLAFLLTNGGRLPQRPQGNSFLMAIHWPSTLSEDGGSFIEKFEPFSFYQMEHRADDVGEEGVYSLLRLVFQNVAQVGAQASRIRLHMLGHSFGTKVMCAALQKLVKEGVAIPANVSFNLVLLQAAFSQDSLCAGGDYDKVIGVANLRILSSKSAADDALKVAFPLANAANFFAAGARTALGFAGPGAATLAVVPFQNVSVAKGAAFTGNPQSPDYLVADLTPIHQDPSNTYDGGWGGHHSDIYLPEIFDLLNWFLFS